MTAGKYDITIERGSDFTLTLTVKEGGSPKHLGGYMAQADLRKTHEATEKVSFDFTDSAFDNTGVLIMKMGYAATTTLDAGNYVYDVELAHPNDNTKIRLLEGKAVVTRDVTRGL